MISWMKRNKYSQPYFFLCFMMVISWSKIYGLNYYWFFNNNFFELQSTALFFMQIAFFAFGGMVLGFLADRFGKEKMIFTAFVLDSIGIFMMEYVADFFMMGVVSAAILFCIGGQFSIGFALIGEKIRQEERSFATGVYLSGAFGGMLILLLIQFISAFVFELRSNEFVETPWDYYFICLGIISILFLINYRNLMKQIFQRKRSENKQEGIHLQIGTEWNWLPIIHRIITIAFFTYTFYGLILYFIILQILSFNIDFQGMILFITLGGLTGTLLSGYISVRLGERKTIALFASIFFLGVIGFIFAKKFGFGEDFSVFLIFTGTGTMVAACKHLGDDFPKQWIGTGISITVHLAHAVGLLSALGTIIMLFVFGFYGALLVFSLTFLLSILLVYLQSISALLKREPDEKGFPLNCHNEIKENAGMIVQK